MSRSSSPKHITGLLQNSKRNGSRGSSSGYKSDSKNENASEKKVENKIAKLLEAANPSPIIEKIKSDSYINKILTLMDYHWLLADDDNKERINNVIIELKARGSKLNQEEKQEEIARDIKELKELKTKLKRLETKLEKLRANKPHYKAKFMEENSENTREKLENAKEILTTNPSDVSDLRTAISEMKSYIIYQENIIKWLRVHLCSRILTPKQVGPICWFMATFVAMFYSRRNRKILLKASSGWNKNDELFTLLKHVLDDKYLSENGKEKDYEKFSDDTFGNILKLLFEKDSKSFPYDPKRNVGFYSEIYICKLYNLLGVDCEMFDYIGYSILAYSYHNVGYDVMDYKFDETHKRYKSSKRVSFDSITDTYYTRKPSNPTILIIRHVGVDHYILGNQISYVKMSEMYNELTSMRDEIKYNSKTYILDSVILANYNVSEGRHAIAGITCKGIKYIYNGWMRTSMDDAMTNQEITRDFPCELMRHDWNVKEVDFCINEKECSIEILKERLPDESRYRFNFSEGDRILIYVRKDAKSKL
jgi:hypothetical protein